MILSACTQKPTADTENTSLMKEKEYIRIVEGKDEPLDPDIIQKGEVLISYSDCSECHKDYMRSKGPAYRDIAKRYPTSKVYIDLLARKVISGGTGSWGNPIMSPHPEINGEDARAMVSYILSLEE